MVTKPTTCNSSACSLTPTLASHALPVHLPADDRLNCCWLTGVGLCTGCVRGNAARPQANRLLYRPGPHCEPEGQPCVRQSAGASRCRTAARRERRQGLLSPGLPRRTCGHAGLLYLLPSSWPLRIAVSAQLQTAQRPPPKRGCHPRTEFPSAARLSTVRRMSWRPAQTQLRNVSQHVIASEDLVAWIERGVVQEGAVRQASHCGFESAVRERATLHASDVTRGHQRTRLT